MREDIRLPIIGIICSRRGQVVKQEAVALDQEIIQAGVFRLGAELLALAPVVASEPKTIRVVFWIRCKSRLVVKIGFMID